MAVDNILQRTGVMPDRALVLIGDEHLYAAAQDVLDPAGVEYTHIFPQAWVRWHDTEFRGSPWFWSTAQWAINDYQRLIYFAEYEDFAGELLVLKPNETYLLSQAIGARGTDSICRLQDGILRVDDPYCQWVVS